MTEDPSTTASGEELALRGQLAAAMIAAGWIVAGNVALVRGDNEPCVILPELRSGRNCV